MERSSVNLNIPFYKYSGCGNDFILIDNRQGNIPASLIAQIPLLCHRHDGIGADGVFLLQAGIEKCDISVVIYNADGSEAELCGNGLRCVVKHLNNDLNIKQDRYSIYTATGICLGKIVDEEIEVTLNEPSIIQGPLRTDILPVAPLYTLRVGVPHVVLLCKDIENLNVAELGRTLRFSPLFAPHGANINFVSLLDSQTISVRTYERGVEGETLACGTGAAASAIVAAFHYQLSSPIYVLPRSQKKLRYQFQLDQRQAKQLVMQGQALRCFEGIYSLPIPTVKTEKTTLREALCTFSS